MSDSTLNRFLAYGTAAQRAAFTPDVPSPASGPSPLYLWKETDTGKLYAYASGAWAMVAGLGADVVGPSSSVAGEIALFDLTTGKLLKRATGTGVVHATSGVYGVTTVALASEVSGDLPLSNLAQASAASKLLGRGSASGGGDFEEITVSSGLTMSGTTLTASTAGRLIGLQIITATGAGTYTPTSGTVFIVVELQGGGAGGGGVASPAGTAIAMGRGGGGGGYIRHRITANFSGASYSVGAKGTGGTAGANNGTAGGNTTFTETGGGGTVYTAAGGALGTGGASLAAVRIDPAVTAGGACTNGSIQVPGGQSIVAFSVAAAQVVGGGGGDSFYGRGGTQLHCTGANVSVAGGNGSGKGAGGAGAVASGTGVARAGGDGTDGILLVWEYS